MELRSNHKHRQLIDCTAHVKDAGPWYFAQLKHQSMQDDFFRQRDQADIHNYDDILAWCIHILSYSPSANLMLKEACEKDWKITLEDLGGSEYCIDVDQKILILDNNALIPSALGRSDYFRHVTLVMMTKALRDIWQEKRYGGFEEQYLPEYILLMERIRAADLDVICALVAWELRSEDHPEIWRHIIGSEIGDIAMAYSAYMERSPTSQFNGMALRTAFQQWFNEEKRINRCDHDTLEYMDDVMCMAVHEKPFGNRKPARINIEMLSCLPDRTAYLQGFGSEVLSDPVYSAVDNEINQTHLFHIMYDLEAIVVENVPFRDVDLARKIFPDE